MMDAQLQPAGSLPKKPLWRLYREVTQYEVCESRSGL